MTGGWCAPRVADARDTVCKCLSVFVHMLRINIGTITLVEKQSACVGFSPWLCIETYKLKKMFGFQVFLLLNQVGSAPASWTAAFSPNLGLKGTPFYNVGHVTSPGSVRIQGFSVPCVK